MLEQLRDMCLHEVYYLSILHFGEVYIARESPPGGQGWGPTGPAFHRRRADQYAEAMP